MAGIVLTGTYTQTVTLSNPALQNPATLAEGGFIDVMRGQAGLYGTADAAWTVDNEGKIGRSFASGEDPTYAISLAGGGAVTNGASASIAARVYGVQISGGLGTVQNGYGVITSSGGYYDNSGFAAVALGAGGIVTNAADGHIGGMVGVSINGGVGTVLNEGTISGLFGHPTSTAILMGGGLVRNGSPTNTKAWIDGRVWTSAATIVNYGTMGIGQLYGFGVLLGGGTITNAANMGPVQGFGGSTTLFNAGFIASDRGTSVALAHGLANRVVVVPGSRIVGSVDGGNAVGSSVASTLELAAAPQAGTLSGIGSHYRGFTRIEVDAGAYWSLPYNEQIDLGMTLANHGTLVLGESLNNSGIILGGVSLRSGGVLINRTGSTIAATGSYVADAAVTTTGATITNLRGAVIAGDGMGIWVSSGGGRITNAGTVIGAAVGIRLDGDGSLTNSAQGVISGAYGVIAGAGATIVNTGRISGTAGTAIVFAAGAGNRLEVGAGARFDGIVDGGSVASTLALTGAGGTLVGFGLQFVDFSRLEVVGGASWTLQGGVGGNATLLYNGGTLLNGVVLDGAILTNTSAGVLSSHGAAYALKVLGGGVVTNAGTILGTGSAAGVYFSAAGLPAPGTLVNLAGATVSGLAAVAGAATIVNGGTISATGSQPAVQMSGRPDDRVMFLPTGRFTGLVDGGGGVLELAAGGRGTMSGLGGRYIHFGLVEVDAGASWTLGGLSTVPRGVTVANDGTLGISGALTSYGTILGTVTLGNGAVLVNGGTMTAAGFGLVVNGGAVTNFASGRIAGQTGIASVALPGTILNAGTTAGIGAGIRLALGGTVQNRATGTISGAAGILIAGGTTTIVNAGAIVAPNSSAPAIRFANANGNRLVVLPGSTIQGQAQGGTGSDTLELGAGIGAVAWLGAHYTGFETLAVQPGAQWRMTGLNTLAGGATLAISAGAGLSVAGTLGVAGDMALARLGALTVLGTGAVTVGVAPASAGAISLAADAHITGMGALRAANIIDAGTITASGGALRLLGNLSGPGTIAIDNNAIMAVYGSLGLPRIAFLAGAEESLVLGNPASFTGTIDGFRATDSIDLLGIGVATDGSYASGAVTVVAPGGVITLHFSGVHFGQFFSLTDDGHGGTLLAYG